MQICIMLIDIISEIKKVGQNKVVKIFSELYLASGG